MLWRKPKYLPAEEAITRGNSAEMEIKYNIAAEGTLKKMKIRDGYNQNEKMFYIQITDRKTLLSYRIYLSDSEYRNLVYNMTHVYNEHGTVTRPAADSQSATSQDIPGSDPATHHSRIGNNPEQNTPYHSQSKVHQDS